MPCKQPYTACQIGMGNLNAEAIAHLVFRQIADEFIEILVPRLEEILKQHSQPCGDTHVHHHEDGKKEQQEKR